MTAALIFVPTYAGGRIVLMLGQHQVGAIFPPWGEGQDRFPWVWRFWLNGSSPVAKEGRVKTELAAKNAILAEAREWLRAAGISDVYQHGIDEGRRQERAARNAARQARRERIARMKAGVE